MWPPGCPVYHKTITMFHFKQSSVSRQGIPCIYEIRRFIISFTKNLDLILSHFNPHTFTQSSSSSLSILSSHLRKDLPGVSSLVIFQQKFMFYKFPISSIHVEPRRVILYTISRRVLKIMVIIIVIIKMLDCPMCWPCLVKNYLCSIC
jgi:hypothetical protein